MPGSTTPKRLDEWPLDEDGNVDVPGMWAFITSKIGELAADIAKFGQRVDQAALDDILERLMVSGLAGLRDDDVEHLANACALAYAHDEFATCRDCGLKIVKSVEKARSELN